MTPAMRASRMLGWVSFAIGAAELIAPKKVAKAVGMNDDHTGLLRAFGARELLAGVGAHSVYPVPALWSRVVGDVVDIATVALSADKDEAGKRNINNWVAIGVLAGVTLVDAMVASRMQSESTEMKGEKRDYSDRTGFPKGAAAAHGAGVVRKAYAGKAGGAAAGDSSPAGLSETGRSQTDLGGAPVETQGSTTGVSGPGEASRTSTGEQASGGQQSSLIGGGQTMSAEAQKVVPEPPSYTPA